MMQKVNIMDTVKRKITCKTEVATIANELRTKHINFHFGRITSEHITNRERTAIFIPKTGLELVFIDSKIPIVPVTASPMLPSKVPRFKNINKA